MIVLDTNVLSELTRPVPDANVIDWLRKQSQADLFTTEISRSEMLYGVHLLPEGGRKARLLQEVLALFPSIWPGVYWPMKAMPLMLMRGSLPTVMEVAGPSASSMP